MDKRTREQAQGIFERHGVVLAYLFGSAARGNTGPLSDVDVAVVFRQPAPDIEAGLQRESVLASELEDVLKREVDLINLADVTSPLLRHRVLRRGAAIYCADHKLRQELELRALHDFEDTRHLRAVVNRAMRGRIVAGTFGTPL